MINMAKKKAKTSGKNSNKRQKEKKKIKNRKPILIVIFILALLGGISAYLLTSPSFTIQEISIKGNNKLSYQQILQLAEVKRGDNLFSKLGIVMKVKLKQNGYIEEAEINKIHPNKIEINIKERKQQFQIKSESEGYIYIDEQGYILEYGVEKLSIPVILGMEVTQKDIQNLHRLQEKDLDKMENILQIREECKNIGISDKITQYQVSEEHIILLENDGIAINLGDGTNLKNRMYYVNAILKQEVGNAGTVFVNGDLNEGFSAYFRANQ